MKKIVLILAPGFEEIEAITPIDVLRRADIDVTVAGLNSLEVKGSHAVTVLADQQLSSIKHADYDGIILPGGLPGSHRLRDSQLVIDLVRAINEKKGLIAAICAAPIVLEKAGIIAGKEFTCYPGQEEFIPSGTHLRDRVVVDGNIVTGKGAGVALEFTLKIVDYLGYQEKATALSKGMIVQE